MRTEIHFCFCLPCFILNLQSCIVAVGLEFRAYDGTLRSTLQHLAGRVTRYFCQMFSLYCGCFIWFYCWVLVMFRVHGNFNDGLLMVNDSLFSTVYFCLFQFMPFVQYVLIVAC